MHIKQTISFCATCYKRIPADIYMSDGKVWMRKICSEHGISNTVVENDADFYRDCFLSNAKGGYPGYFLDITSRCNISCKHCYYNKNTHNDPSVENILQEAQLSKNFGPAILIGGEPTVRSDIVELIARLYEINPRIAMITNGIELPNVLDEILKYLCPLNDIINIELSIHPESDGADIRAIEFVQDIGLKLDSVLFMIDELGNLDEALEFCMKYKGAINSVRLRTPSMIWNEKEQFNQIFVSDMLKYLKDRYEVDVRWWDNNKSCYFNLDINGIHCILVSWSNVSNIDLVDKAYPPFYMANNGSVEGLLTSLIINEGIDRGWLNGKRLKES